MKTKTIIIIIAILVFWFMFKDRFMSAKKPVPPIMPPVKQNYND